MRQIGLILIFLVTSEATHCSWDPIEASLVCALNSSRTILSFTKHQTEATRTLRLLCENSNVNSIEVHYDRRRSKPWPHLIKLQIEKCSLTSINLKVDGVFWPHNGDVLRDFVQPLISDLHGLRYISFTEISDKK